jgi:molecular chaperone GrpE
MVGGESAQQGYDGESKETAEDTPRPGHHLSHFPRIPPCSLFHTHSSSDTDLVDKGAPHAVALADARTLLSQLEECEEAAALTAAVETLGETAAAAAAAAAAVEARAEAAEASAEAGQAQSLRLQADFDNFRKRADAEKAATADRVKGDVTTALLPLVDAFDAAAGAVKAETPGEERIKGAYQALATQLTEILGGLGVARVPGAGAPFDPAVHDAIAREPAADGVADGTVTVEFRAGFTVGGRLVRPAMVKVAYEEEATAEAVEPVGAGAAGAEEE